MATKLENLKIELAHYNHIEPYLISYYNTQGGKFKIHKKRKDLYITNGHIQVSSMFESVMAYLSCSAVISTNSADLENGADCKLTTVRHVNSRKGYSASVCDITHKTGTLYVMCYERMHQKFYYFAIPNHTYCMIPDTSNIEIPFNIDGTPRRTPLRTRTYANWWDYECTSLADMSSFCGTTGVRLPYNRINSAIINAHLPPTWAILFEGL